MPDCATVLLYWQNVFGSASETIFPAASSGNVFLLKPADRRAEEDASRGERPSVNAPQGQDRSEGPPSSEEAVEDECPPPNAKNTKLWMQSTHTSWIRALAPGPIAKRSFLYFDVLKSKLKLRAKRVLMLNSP